MALNPDLYPRPLPRTPWRNLTSASCRQRPHPGRDADSDASCCAVSLFM